MLPTSNARKESSVSTKHGNAKAEPHRTCAPASTSIVRFHFDCLFADLQQYKQENGDLSIPVAHPLLSSIMDKLSSIGMEELLRKRWDDQFASLRAFKEKYEDCLVPPAHPTLGKWARIQCDHYRLYRQRLPSPLTKERFHLLKDLGFGELVHRENTHVQERTKESLGDRPKKTKGGESGKVSSAHSKSLTLKLEVGDRPHSKKIKRSPKASSAPPKSLSSSVPPKSLSLLTQVSAEENVVLHDSRKNGSLDSFENLLERKIKVMSRSSGSSQSSNGSNVSKGNNGGVHRKPQTKKVMVESFDIRLKKKMELEASNGSRPTQKAATAVRSFEDRLKKKLRDEHPEAPPVPPKKDPPSSEKKAALDSFEDRLKKKLGNDHPRESPVPSKPSLSRRSVGSDADASNDLTLSQKIDRKIQSKRRKKRRKTVGDEKPHSSAADTQEKRILRRSARKVFGRRKVYLLGDTTEEESGEDDTFASTAQNLAKNAPLMSSVSANRADSDSDLKKSIALSRLLSEDDIDVDYSEYARWSQLDGAIAAAIKQSLVATNSELKEV